MRTFHGHTAIRTGATVAAIAAIILAGVFTVFRAEAAALSEVKKLLASDAQAFDEFGFSVAVSGDTAVVGAQLEAAGGTDAGAAYVYQRDQGGPGNWGELTKLTATDAQPDDWFGRSVAISGGTAIVGAFSEDAGGSAAGAAYVFERDQGGPGNWGQVKKLTATDAQAGDWFGISVAISGNTAIVGAQSEDGPGGPLDDRGTAYVFERDQGGPGNWGQVKKLTATDAQSADLFGASVAVSGDTAVIGAFVEDTGAAYGGAAYVFQRDQGGPGNWGETKKLIASDAQMFDFFGRRVAVSGNTAVVGAWQEDAGGSNAGAAYVFQRNVGGADNWGEVKKLIASDAQAGDGLGVSVAISGYTVVVGAYQEDAGGSNAGAAYTFERNEGGPDTWGEVQKLTASDAQADDVFGASVAITGDTVVVGALREDAEATDAGAAYVFEPPQLSSSPLITPASKGTNILDVSDVSIYSMGDSVLINPGNANEETRTVTGFGSLLVDAPLDFDHSAGEPVVVIAGGPVGGIAELPDVAGVPLETGASSGAGVGVLAGVAGVVAAGAVALGSAAWYTRRRRG